MLNKQKQIYCLLNLPVIQLCFGAGKRCLSLSLRSLSFCICFISSVITSSDLACFRGSKSIAKGRIEILINKTIAILKHHPDRQLIICMYRNVASLKSSTDIRCWLSKMEPSFRLKKIIGQIERFEENYQVSRSVYTFLLVISWWWLLLAICWIIIIIVNLHGVIVIHSVVLAVVVVRRLLLDFFPV